jgi:5-oxoprolinase (ATP-hydrolysing)
VRFLEPMDAALLSNHRIVAPFALAGGSPGACGRQWVEREGGAIEALPGCAKIRVRPGDVFVIQTPAGGGFGPPAGA